MKTRYVNIFHNNVKKSLENSMFDVQKNKAFDVPIFVKLKNYLEQRYIYINTYDVSPKKIIYRNIHIDMPYPQISNFLPWKHIISNKEKNILIATEPPLVNPFNYMKIFHRFFLKIYTWNDKLVDNKKYFKIRLPKYSIGMNTKPKKFKDKKFLILINANKLPFYPFKLLSSFGRELYSERVKAIEFFEEKISDKFFLYGRGWNKPKKYNLKETLLGFKRYSTYKGEIDNKIELLSNFKYCICFENITNIEGFITEKIFDCFKAKCVPIYWGATNIESYIPKGCFIDFREFNDYKKLLSYLESIDEIKYNTYIQNIENLLMDKKFIESWFEEGYAKFFCENILETKNND